MSGRSKRAHVVTSSRSRAVVAVFAALATSAFGLVAFATPALAAPTTFTVTSAADPGDGVCDSTCTLREAINAANGNAGADTIAFNIGGGGGATISPAVDLPPINDPVTIDGTTQPGFSGAPLIYISGTSDATSGSMGIWLSGTTGSVVQSVGIGGFVSRQIFIQGGATNLVVANYIGTTASGNATVAGGNFGQVEAQNSASNQISNNVIGGGQAGVIVSSNSTQTLVGSNYIGIGADGTSSIGSGGAGILVTGGGTRGTNIRFNDIANNTGLGIDLEGNGKDTNDAGDVDTGPNDHQNYPVIGTAVAGPTTIEIQGTLDSVAGGTFHLDYFANQSCDSSGNGEGRLYLGSSDVFTDLTGHGVFDSTVANPAFGYDYITATATRDDSLPVGNETSEFSACVARTNGVTAPTAPTGVSAGAGDAEATISWNPPDSDGGAELTNYTVTSSPASPNSPMDVDASFTSATMTGLANGTNYTFTVSATNDQELTSPASDPSNQVQPQSGAPDPESQSTELGPGGGTLSTGSDASSTDPTNTTVQSPNQGIVTIGESTLTGTPPAGVTYFGQQVDISAPDAAADDPMTFSFVYDCSVLPAGTSSCAEPIAPPGPPAAPALAPATASVNVNDGSYSPTTASVRQGGSVTWHFQGTRQHSVTDKVGLGAGGSRLFNSGNRSPGATYSYAFVAAGQYSYRSFAPHDSATMTGIVSVPVEVSADTAAPATPVTVTWATSRPSGFRFDTQYRFKSPTASTYGSWRSFRSNTLMTSGSFTGAGLRGEGGYQFRSHLENMSTGKKSGWSDPVTVTVSTTTTGGSGEHLDDIAVFHEDELGSNVQVPDCTGAEGVVQPGPACTWSETIRPDGDLEIVVYTTHNNRWRAGKTAPAGTP